MPMEACVKALWKRFSLSSSARRCMADCAASRSAASTRLRRTASSASCWRKKKCSVVSSIATMGTTAISTPGPDCATVRNSRPATDALPA